MTEFNIEKIVLKEFKTPEDKFLAKDDKNLITYDRVYALPKRAGVCFEWDPCDDAPKNGKYKL